MSVTGPVPRFWTPPPLPVAPAKFWEMVQSVSVTVPVPKSLLTPPPPALLPPEFPVMVQLVSVVVPERLFTPPPAPGVAELPLTVQLVSVSMPLVVHAAADTGGVAAEGAVVQREIAAVVVQAAAVASIAPGDRQSRD